MPTGSRGAWRGFPDDADHHQHTRPHWCGGRRRDRRAWLRCPWAVAGPGRASRRRAERSSRRGRLAGGPPPTGTHCGRGLRRPQHPWGHSNTWRPITPILIVGPNQPKYRLSRTRKPKSHAPSNTRSVLYPRIAARAGGYTKAAPRRRGTRPTENVLNEISASRTAKPCGPS